MVFEKEVRIARKCKIKDSVNELAAQLAIITNPFSEGNVDDLLERLICLEANRYKLLPEDEVVKLNHYIAVASNKEPVAINNKPIPRQEVNSVLPLGKVRDE